MPTKIKTIRFAYNEVWDMVVRTEFEMIIPEAREYAYRRIILYTPCSEFLPKTRTI